MMVFGRPRSLLLGHAGSNFFSNDFEAGSAVNTFFSFTSCIMFIATEIPEHCVHLTMCTVI